jgi:uncharacterized protein (TIGR03435 family)
MNERLACKLEIRIKPLLTAVGLLAVATLVVFGLTNATQTWAASQAQNTCALAPVYEVASIKLNKSANGIMYTWFKPNGFAAKGFTLRMLIGEAYGIEDNQISGAPNWLNKDLYDIEAKVGSSVADELRKLNAEQLRLQGRRMLKALLAERFKLTLHREAKELPVYALVIAKNGPKLQEAKPGDTYPNGLKGFDGGGGAGMLLLEEGRLVGQGVPVEFLARHLSEQLHRKVLDKTGLKGNYDFTLRWTPDESQSQMFEGAEGGQQRSENTPSPESSGPSIATAIREQLGLKLESQKGSAEVLVIDHVERPSEN